MHRRGETGWVEEGPDEGNRGGGPIVSSAIFSVDLADSPAGRVDDWIGRIGGRELDDDNQEQSCRSFPLSEPPRP